MINQGADPKLIQTQLGHSSISITYDIYGHLFPDRLDELASKFDELIREGRQGRDQNRLVALNMCLVLLAIAHYTWHR
jgi:hypothetical protein